MKPKTRVALIVPAYNEEHNLTRLVERFRAVREQLAGLAMEAELVLINDGSMDGTARVGRENGFTVLSHPFNLGVCGALHTGFMYALQSGHDCLITIDADGQHNPEDISTMVAELRRESADLVIGSRFLINTGYKKNLARYTGIVLFSWIVKLLTDQTISDVTSGFRMFTRKAIEFLANHFPQDYPDAEMLILLSKSRFTIREIPVQMNPRMSGRSQHNFITSLFYPFKNLIAIVVVLIRTFLAKKEELHV
ncbi:glycosyltransferase family 2 protein [bacterium]|nr:glycosyltransferase family 2 protein [bacterium]